MTTIFNTMQVALTVQSVKAKGYCATVRIVLGSGPDAEVSILKDIYISGLAKYYFNDLSNTKFVKKREYVSSNNSDNYLACPITIIRTCDQKTGKEKFTLKVVNEGKSIPRQFTTPKGIVKNYYQFTTIPKNKWLRYGDWFDYHHKRYLKSMEAVSA